MFNNTIIFYLVDRDFERKSLGISSGHILLLWSQAVVAIVGAVLV